MTRFAAIDEKKRAQEGDKAPPIAKGFFFRPSAKELRPLWQASPPSALTLPARSELELPLFLSQRCRSNLSSVPGAWKGQEIEARCRVAARFASSLSNSAPAFRSLSRSCRRLFAMSSTTESADQFFYFSLSLSLFSRTCLCSRSWTGRSSGRSTGLGRRARWSEPRGTPPSSSPRQPFCRRVNRRRPLPSI